MMRNWRRSRPGSSLVVTMTAVVIMNPEAGFVKPFPGPA